MDVSSKFRTKIEWKKGHPNSYSAAHKNNWVIECSKHMTIIRNSRHFWSLEKCYLEAQKFETKTEWRINSYKSYIAAKRNCWIKECSKHMKIIGSLNKRAIYAFEFSDNFVYVGLTYNLDKRFQEHINNNSKEQTAVYKHIEKTKLKPRFIILTEYHDNNIAVIKEAEFLEKYKKEGWRVLNISKTGGLGKSKIIWSKEICKIEALKFNHKFEWQKQSKPSYRAALRNDWINELSSHMVRPSRKH